MGGIIDGCPPGLRLDTDLVQAELDRRKPGTSGEVSRRKEPDRVEFLSGLLDGRTTGAPLAFLVYNHDQRSEDYASLSGILRPSHADLSVFLKYGIYDHRGGGRLSGRETVSRVAAGAVARQLLSKEGTEVMAFTTQIGEYAMKRWPAALSHDEIYASPVRCPDPKLSEEMSALLASLREKGDSTGGVISCLVKNPPPGLGEPVFDKLDADLARAMMSIGGARGFELGEGFASAAMSGSEHNDAIGYENGRFFTHSNHAGGILGGISNGMDIFFRVAFKPVASISLPQRTVTTKGDPKMLIIEGRHDPCIVPRAVAVVEAMTALVLADHLLRHRF